MTGKQIDHFNTHFCVCTDTISMCCGQDGQYQSAKEVQAAMELYHRPGNFTLKFIYSEKATKFFEIFPLLLTLCTVVKSKGKISQNFVAFSEYIIWTLTKITHF